jgi:hypothetical protein
MACDPATPPRRSSLSGETERVANAPREPGYSREAGKANVSGTANAPAGRLRSRGFMIAA